MLNAEEASRRDAMETLTEGIDLGMRELIATAPRLPHVAPPLYWLDWVLRTTPASGAPDLLALRAQECTRAAQILSSAVALSQENAIRLPEALNGRFSSKSHSVSFECE